MFSGFKIHPLWIYLFNTCQRSSRKQEKRKQSREPSRYKKFYWSKPHFVRGESSRLLFTSMKSLSINLRQGQSSNSYILSRATKKPRATARFNSLTLSEICICLLEFRSQFLSGFVPSKLIQVWNCVRWKSLRFVFG